MTTGQKSRRLALLGVLLIGVPATLAAQQAPAPADTVPQYDIPGVTVTVTRSTADRHAVPQTIEVVTPADVERTPAAELPDLLKKVSAVDVIQYPGLLSGVGMRGFRPQFSGINQRTLVLVDGRPAGATNLSLLPMHAIQQIEVLKGPASSLYGSNAMGGAINIVTRRSAGVVGGNVSAGYGSWNTLELRGNVGGAITQELDFDLGLSIFDRGGDFRIGGGNLFRDMLGGESLTRRAPDGSATQVTDPGDGEVRPFTQYGSRAGNVRLGYRLADGVRIDVRGDRFAADRVQGPGDILAAWDNRSLRNVARNSGEIGLSAALGQHTLTAKAYGSAEDSDNFNIPEASDGREQFVNLRTLARWRGVQVQDVFRLGDHTLTAGFDFNGARSESERFIAPGERGAPWEPDARIASRALFANGRFALLDERVVATLGGRLDNIGFQVFETEFLPTHIPNRESNTVFNPSAGLQYRSDGGVRVRTSAGRAFVAPQAFQVAGRAEQRIAPGARTIDLTRGNPEIRPENSFTWDAGVDYFSPDRGIEADLTYFHTGVRDRITTQRTDVSGVELTPAGDTIRSVTTYVNADRAEIRGLEGRLSYDFGVLAGNRYALRLFANGTRIIRAEEVTAGVTRDIQNVADLNLNYGLEWDDLQRFGARITGRYVGERKDTDWADWTNPAEVTYPAFMVLDLAADARVTDRYRLGAQVTNLTDEHFYEVRGFPLPGRALRLSVSADF